MGLNTYTIERFIGINQSADENMLPPSFTCDAVNMDTTDGKLSVGKGYMKHIDSPVPGTEPIDKLIFFRGSHIDAVIAITGEKIYAYKLNGGWELIYTYAHLDGAKRYNSITVRIGTADYLVISDGIHQLIKYDGTAVTLFGSEENCSDIPAAYLTLYRGRLFAAGDNLNPNRIYYSCLPGGDRTVENWGYIEASPAVEGGHAEVGSAGGDGIVAIKALSNQLLIFKRNSLYRLIGDRPSNFTIERINASIKTAANGAAAVYGDIIYFITKAGLYYYNGVTARPCPDMRAIKNIMASSLTVNSKAVIAGDKLYFTVRHKGKDAMLEYDLIERKYMLRNGFKISDIAAFSGKLMLINDSRFVYVFGTGSSYDGQSINAYWYTPLTDFQDKASIKSLHELYIRGSGDILRVETRTDEITARYRVPMPESGTQTLEIPLKNEGRCIRLKFYNEKGGSFCLEGGAEISLGIRKRVI